MARFHQGIEVTRQTTTKRKDRQIESQLRELGAVASGEITDMNSEMVTDRLLEAEYKLA